MTPTAIPTVLAARRAFSLIELLVVITIIAVVIAITVPAIGAARDLARGTATQSQLASLSSAVSSFQTDTNRVPGYFTAADMSDNADGFTSMQNVILDLAGGPVSEQVGTAQGLPLVGPNSSGDAEVHVNPALIGIDGVNTKSYLRADAVDFQSVEGKIGVGNNDNLIIPEIVDSWGTPVMAWVENEFAPQMTDLPNPEIENFAAEDEMAGIARFYWEQNVPVLESRALGERQTDQNESALNIKLSGGPMPLNAQDKGEVLAALLGSTAQPLTTAGRRGIASANVSTFLPSASKGSVVFHSAGRDRVFLSTEDNGYRELSGSFEYPRNFSPAGTGRLGENPWSNPDNENGTKDIVGLFNDIVTATPR
ncbi:MAG: prepilin-type N-terminal cleavage/methylation domain-containing protein [Planctomycetota bacterium]